jgi:hypothetical protein
MHPPWVGGPAHWLVVLVEALQDAASDLRDWQCASYRVSQGSDCERGWECVCATHCLGMMELLFS